MLASLSFIFQKVDSLMRKMEGEVDCFNVGATVSCRTCLDKDIEGEVVAYDAASKMLIVKSDASSGRPSLNNIHMLNLSFVSKVEVKKDSGSERPPEPQSLNISRLNMRAREQIDKKKKLVNALKAGVSPDGQRLFMAINKTIDEVNWDREEIVVMKNVRITPPYTPECVKGDPAASNHVRKIVEKHLKDREEATRPAVGAN